MTTSLAKSAQREFRFYQSLKTNFFTDLKGVSDLLQADFLNESSRSRTFVELFHQEGIFVQETRLGQHVCTEWDIGFFLCCCCCFIFMFFVILEL